MDDLKLHPQMTLQEVSELITSKLDEGVDIKSLFAATASTILRPILTYAADSFITGDTSKIDVEKLIRVYSKWVELALIPAFFEISNEFPEGWDLPRLASVLDPNQMLDIDAYGENLSKTLNYSAELEDLQVAISESSGLSVDSRLVVFLPLVKALSNCLEVMFLENLYLETNEPVEVSIETEEEFIIKCQTWSLLFVSQLIHSVKGAASSSGL
ncbi:hypothetical protein LCGC14_0145050 [marine sediment metagenome]|uniref:Uncharacterized protein n=1 Tax=marine sediment metagenome TaxID=412755 RepID=A0A0F9Y192_9ZZZZ